MAAMEGGDGIPGRRGDTEPQVPPSQAVVDVNILNAYRGKCIYRMHVYLLHIIDIICIDSTSFSTSFARSLAAVSFSQFSVLSSQFPVPASVSVSVSVAGSLFYDRTFGHSNAPSPRALRKYGR